MSEPARTVSIFHKGEAPILKKAGEVIFTEGEPGDVMYGLLMGEVDLVVNGKVVETIHVGDVFGEGVLVHPSGKRASTAVARQDSSLVYLNQERFLFAVQSTPMFAIEVMRSYSERLRRLKHLI
ncbi:MAG: Crp/Fnr family transcriptional regulator [Acaryochloridaceae cyanobacterium SU_2_1]|nr:Crp/Fnr family transcriptional regulator [Acaryochloridaceae cyanobacterium SU_2_1]